MTTSHAPSDNQYYRDGWDSWHAGKSWNDCNWARGTFQRGSWMKGYFAARDAMQLAVAKHVTKPGDLK